MDRVVSRLTAIAAVTLLAFSLRAQPASETAANSLSPEWVSTFDWRLIGPANMSGRIVDLAVYEANPKIYYVASASGGLLKTVNNGVTFEHQFDHESSVSIGDVAVAATNPDIVWVGTGEQNPRNSVSWGDGVYKSTDGGKTWENMGLRDSFQIGRVLIHPENPDIVLVGALGRLWGPSQERGVYRTTDAGKTWNRTLFIDDKSGIIDMAFDPNDPTIVLAASWERQRDEFDTNDPAKRWGPGSGLYRSEDNGQTWTPVTEGLPTVDKGRMSIEFSGSNPGTVYLLVDTVRIGEGLPNAGYGGLNGTDADAGARLTQIVEEGPAAKAGLKENDVVISIAGERIVRYDDLLSAIRVREAGTVLPVEVVRDGKILEVELTLGENPNPNRKPFERDLGGQRESIQDQQGPDGLETGGLFRSDDHGKTWTRINSINPRPMYFSKVYADPSDDNYLWILGIPLSKSEDNGKTWTRDGTPDIVHVDHHALWIDPNDGEHLLLGNDGGLYVSYDRGKTFDHLNHFAIGQAYHVAVDNRPLYNVYAGYQDNGSWGGPNRTRGGEGPYNSDWFRVGGGDGFVCAIDETDPDQIYAESQEGGMTRLNLRTGERGGIRPRAPRGVQYRFNWKTPYLLSHHNSEIFYAAGNFVFRSLHKGDDIKQISPEITRTRRGSATALDESPLDADLLMVGTDDGALWVTNDGGANWENIIYPFDESAYPEVVEDTSASVGEADNPQRGGPGGFAGRGGPGAPGGPGTPGGPGGRRFDLMARFDANSDGKLQFSEAPERMLENMKVFDEDKDEALSAEELEKWREFQRASGGPGGAPGGERPARGQRAPQPEAQAEGGEARPEEAPAAEAGGASPEETPAAEPVEHPATEPQPESVPAAEAEPEAPAAEPETPVFHPELVGTWEGSMQGRRGGGRPGGPPPFTIYITDVDETTINVQVDTGFLNGMGKATAPTEPGQPFNFSIEGGQGRVDFAAKLEGDALVGSFTAGEGQFTAEWRATRKTEGASAEPAGPKFSELVPGPRRVQSIEWSKFSRERVYVVLDGHYANDDEPYVSVSNDAGKTWASLRANLPKGSTRVLREDLENEDLLYLGTEFGLYVSIDRGKNWTKFHSDLPTVAIHEVAQHATSGEIIVGTHGRSLWALDVTPLRQMTGDAMTANVQLYRPNDVTLWSMTSERGRGASRWFAGENPVREAHVYFSVRRPTDVSIEIRDVSDKVVRQLELPEDAGRPGLHRVDWDLRRDPPAGGARNVRFRRGGWVEPGTYRVVLTAGDVTLSSLLRVDNDPDMGGDVFNVESFTTEFYGEEELEGRPESETD